jgi:TolA-binding protein
VSDERPPLSADRIASAFSQLSAEHAAKRVQADASAAWRRIVIREGARAQRAAFGAVPFGFRLLIPAVALVALAALAVAWPKPDLAYELQGTTAQNGLISTRAETAKLAFSDRSQIDVAAHTTLRVDVVGRRSALARLTAGKLSVSVAHEDDTDWRFFAGPYEIRVVGTRFDVGWEPAGERLSLAMREGSVRIIGPQVDRLLSAGEKIDWAAAPEPVAAASPEPPRSEPAPAALETPEPLAAAVQHAQPRAPSSAKADDWAALVAKGQFSAVIRAAEASGVEQVLAQRGSADLKALAQAARYTGRAALAIRAFQALRQRFAQQSAGRQAAFFLGRIYDQQGKSVEALRWLNAYLGEAPGDVYASEALGRRLTLVQRTEGNAAAARVARQYLERFPSGAYARTARALLE